MEPVIAIDDIKFDYEELWTDDEMVNVLIRRVDIRYTVYRGNNELDGEITLPFREYENMKYSDLMFTVREHLKGIVKGI